MVQSSEIKFKTRGAGDIVNLTPDLEKIIREGEIDSGVVTIFTPSATSGLTTLEYEPGLLRDLPQLLEEMIPSDRKYYHDETWHDGNGFSHLRAALIGPSLSVPFTASQLTLGTWQQVVFLEFDNRPRQRRVSLQIIGE
ncbi:MAG: secondary thiamine-phosphate synthase enzyme YjbQ [Candidatus Zixiibacteriota bacterium]